MYIVFVSVKARNSVIIFNFGLGYVYTQCGFFSKEIIMKGKKRTEKFMLLPRGKFDPSFPWLIFREKYDEHF